MKRENKKEEEVQEESLEFTRHIRHSFCSRSFRWSTPFNGIVGMKSWDFAETCHIHLTSDWRSEKRMNNSSAWKREKTILTLLQMFQLILCNFIRLCPNIIPWNVSKSLQILLLQAHKNFKYKTDIFPIHHWHNNWPGYGTTLFIDLNNGFLKHSAWSPVCLLGTSNERRISQTGNPQKMFINLSKTNCFSFFFFLSSTIIYIDFEFDLRREHESFNFKRCQHLWTDWI